MPQNRLEVQQTQKLSQSMQTVIRMLSMDLDALSEYIQKAIEENPALELVPPQKSAHDYAMFVRSRYSDSRGEYRNPDAPAPVSTVDDLAQQLRLAGLDAAILRTAMRMLHMLSPRGYFPQEIEVFAKEAGISPDVALQALEAVQALEPAGIGARSVEECLCLQLREKPDADPLCYDLIRRYLPEIGKGALRQIARETGAPLARVNACVEMIRSLTPSPCSLSMDAVQYIMPEFSVETDADGRLTILFHNDYYPSVRQDNTFQRLLADLTGDELTFARKAQASASQLIRAVDMRQSTMEKIAQIIVREQRAFFLGEYSLLPMRIEDVAHEIGVHETTVYRALRGKYLSCARGTFPLNHFFQKEVSGGVSAQRVKEMILAICSGDTKLSDREIADALKARGVSLSRRTVAKYRAQMNIDSSFRRGAEEKE